METTVTTSGWGVDAGSVKQSETGPRLNWIRLRSGVLVVWVEERAERQWMTGNRNPDGGKNGGKRTWLVGLVPVEHE